MKDSVLQSDVLFLGGVLNLYHYEFKNVELHEVS